MALRSKLLLLSLFLISGNGYTRSKLPELTTKQDIKNIRYVSTDGKFTYYQRSDGSLQFSTNYKVEEVLELKPKTQFKILATPTKKHLLLEADESYHRYMSLRNPRKVYVIDYGTKVIRPVGEGRAINLHFNDQYASLYDFFARKLTIVNHINTSVSHSVKMANDKNPYFKPEVEMTDTDTAYYTDINKEGIPGILKFRLNAKKVDLFYKAASHNKVLELCLNEKSFFILEKGIDPLDQGTTIKQLSRDEMDMTKAKLIYESPENDLGSLICQRDKDKIYFVKTYRSKEGKLTYDAVSVKTPSKDIEKLSDIEFATNLILMDKMLLAPYQDKFYILKGENNLTDFDKLKKSQEKE